MQPAKKAPLTRKRCQVYFSPATSSGKGVGFIFTACRQKENSALLKVINRRGTIVEERSLYAFQAQDFGVKIEIFLRVADTHRDMVMSH